MAQSPELKEVRDTFLEESIDGQTFLQLNEGDFCELGIRMENRKLLRFLQENLQKLPSYT